MEPEKVEKGDKPGPTKKAKKVILSFNKAIYKIFKNSTVYLEISFKITQDC